MKKKPQKNANLPTEAGVALDLSLGFSLAVWIGIGLAGIIAAILVYSTALGGPFVFDDQSSIFLDPRANAIPLSGWFGVTRGLTNLSYWVN